MTQKQLDFPPYPVRNAFFCLKAMRLMSHYRAAERVGTLGFCILSEIALTEDRRRYKSAPTFWQSSFQDRFSRGREAIRIAIRRCIDSGWLYWRQEHRCPAVAWILIPPFVDESVLNDYLSGPLCLENRPQNQAQHLPQDQAQHLPQDQAQHLPQDQASSILPQTHAPPSPEWAAVVDRLIEFGLSRYQRCIRSAQSNGLHPQDVLSLCQFWDNHREGFQRPLGALHCALTATRPQSMRDLANCFPPLDPAFLAEKQSAGRQAWEAQAKQEQLSREAAQATVLDAERQLLFDFERQYGSRLNELTDAELQQLCASLPASVRSSMQQFKLGRTSPLVRPDLLKALAKSAMAASPN